MLCLHAAAACLLHPICMYAVLHLLAQSTFQQPVHVAHVATRVCLVHNAVHLPADCILQGAGNAWQAPLAAVSTPHKERQVAPSGCAGLLCCQLVLQHVATHAVP